ncbi:serine acetyltransferase [Salmonella enterica]|uniref:serine O-acetyltransferase n=3 Tax=Salmonella enterica TaxID=28901 RepID=A0A402WMT3_SALER|nr:serine O-acetyltransferase [Salmonella enterica]EDY0793110.1 serine acetyltransferase [Salmonella enterica subsp. diarizonae]EAA7556552.1 serine acetyltransferase [Salmonella enterica]EAP6367467.1 serine acetyltransferase [Salmonella enterica]EAQ9985021.1 serine acetyltransferase [Salmonella enterica]EAS2066850.1 serine acetyltransferase [Salmonella enterica]
MNKMPISFIINGLIFNILYENKIFYLTDGDINLINRLCYDDLYALSEKDPAGRQDLNYIAITYSSYFAVLSYRISHFLYDKGLFLDAKIISENAKIKTGIEIHPAAIIGKRFVVDHGTGTVIGETSIIGEDCYILQSVIIGSSGIANNPIGKRHPVIGNNVEIGAFVNLLGNIKIGDNVKISPRVTLKNSVPDNVIVTKKTEIKILKK